MPAVPRKLIKSVTKKPMAPRKQRSNAKVDPLTIEPKLREYIVRRNGEARGRAIEALLSAVDEYRAEEDREDSLHVARLSQREEGLMRTARGLLDVRPPFENLTQADLEGYRRKMEWVGTGFLGKARGPTKAA